MIANRRHFLHFLVNRLNFTLMIPDAIKKLITHESFYIQELLNQTGEIEKAASLCAKCRGRIIVTGIGKSGVAARKISSTLTSMGSPAIFLHPTEALHGDLGIISAEDIAICISKSGRTRELEHLIAHFKRWGIPIIAITSESNSPLAKNSKILLQIPTVEEGEPLGIIPTTSVICSIALGDAITAGMVLIKKLTKDQFSVYHPGGEIGHQLTQVSELMHTGDEIPKVSTKATLRDAIVEISNKKFGTSLIIEENKLMGIITDGDVRRAIQRTDISDPLGENVMHFASSNPKTISPDSLAEEALSLMERYKITSLIVKTENEIVGFIHLHDILDRKVV